MFGHVFTLLFCVQLAEIDLFEGIFGEKNLFNGLRGRNRAAIQPVVGFFEEIGMRVEEKRRFLLSTVRTARQTFYWSLFQKRLT